MRGLYRGFAPYLILSLLTNGLIEIKEDDFNIYSPERLRRQIFVYIGNSLLIIWRIMLSLEN